jgi:hypothetical protein
MATVEEDEFTLEYVRPTKTRKGYWRHVRYDRQLPSINQRKARAMFATAALEKRDSFGKTEIVGKDGVVKEGPVPAKGVQERMKGARVAPEKLPVVSDYVLVDLAKIKEMAETLREIKGPSA